MRCPLRHESVHVLTSIWDNIPPHICVTYSMCELLHCWWRGWRGQLVWQATSPDEIGVSEDKAYFIHTNVAGWQGRRKVQYHHHIPIQSFQRDLPHTPVSVKTCVSSYTSQCLRWCITSHMCHIVHVWCQLRHVSVHTPTSVWDGVSLHTCVT